jgi:hypothetical protein
MTQMSLDGSKPDLGVIDDTSSKSFSLLSITKGKSKGKKVKVDLKCYKNCKLRYFDFIKKIGNKLNENLIQNEIKEKRMMQDAKKIGPIED